MDTDLIWQRIDEQRLELAALIETLTPEQLATPSLCDDPPPRGEGKG